MKIVKRVSHIPFFSVVIATYNSFDFLEFTLKSLLDQNVYLFEVVIVDDGSSIKFKKYLDTLVKKYVLLGLEIKLFKCKHRGISFVRNFGVQNSLGEYIYVLDSDDELVINSLQLVQKYIFKSKNPDFVFGDIILINSKGTQIGSRVYSDKGNLKMKLFLSFIVPFKHSAMIYKKSSFVELGGYDLKFKRLVDISLFIKFFNAGKSIFHLPYFISKYRVHKMNFSDSRLSNLKYWYMLCDDNFHFLGMFFKLWRTLIEYVKLFFIMVNFKR